MLRELITVAVALAAASPVWAQTPPYSRRPVPFDRKPVERTDVKEPKQADTPERPAKAEPASASRDAKPM
jgi:hypothetical protein